MMGCFGIRPLVVSMVACVGIAVSANGQAIEPCEVQTLTSGGGPLSDAFGGHTALGGETLVVGAHGDDKIAQAAGAVYVYTRDGFTWTLQQRLDPPQPGFEQGFGFSVDIDGDVLVVGAPGISSFTGQIGEAYVFRRSGGVWTEDAMLVSSGSSKDDRFGWWVSLDGDRIAVGAPGHPDIQSGRAYVFVWSGSAWVEEAALQGSDTALEDRFASSVGIDGSLLMVGAPRHDGAEPSDPDCDSGALYVFALEGSSWEQRATLLPDDTGCFQGFGEAVALEGSAAAVGATGHSAGAGSAYVFTEELGSWTEQTRLLVSDGASLDHFGKAVAIQGDRVLVGAPEDDTDAGLNSGSAYLFGFDGQTWQQVFKFLPKQGGSSQEIGAGVALAGDWAVIGAPAVSRAHVYSIRPAPPCIPAVSTLGLAGMALVTVVAGGLLLRRRGARDSTSSSLEKEKDDDRTTGSDRGDWSCPPPERLILRRPIIPRACWCGSNQGSRRRRRLRPTGRAEACARSDNMISSRAWR